LDALTTIAEPRRRRLLQLCWDEERSVNELHEGMPDITLGGLSQHLGRLRDAGLVTVRRDGRRRLYRADQQALGPLRDGLEAMWTARLDQLGALVREEGR
jgi:DNA-binding transcriptional ArsR family regulator